MTSNLAIRNKINTYTPHCKTFVKKQCNAVQNEIKASKAYYQNNARFGWKRGQRLAEQKHLGTIQSFALKTYSSVSNTKVRRQDIPTIMAGIGMLVPFWGTSVLFYGVGKIFCKALNLFSKH